MAPEVVELLRPGPGHKIVDGTLGEGGHAELLAGRILPDGVLIGIERDSSNLSVAAGRLEGTGVKKMLFCDSYANIQEIAESVSAVPVNAILLDLGFSTRHIEVSGRGFSFRKDEPLDMRYDISRGFPLSDWINDASRDDIADVLRKYSDEKECARIARAIIYHRENSPIRTSMEISGIIAGAKRKTGKKTHPATKAFQAFRIFINGELEELERGLKGSLAILAKGARLAVLTYHSIEDRIVKRFFKEHSGTCVCPPGFPECRCLAGDIRPRVRILKESGIRPSSEEIYDNRSARSAHLRCCEIVLEREN